MNVLVGAGDIAGCSSQKDEETATLLDGIGGTVFTTGDNAYPDGTDANFRDCYDPTWGRHKDRTRPSPGNHDYHVADAAGYFRYFGAAAGEIGKGYYSYDVADWHIIALNSECSAVGGCGPGSPQADWLEADLAANPGACTLAYWHRPLFSSGSHGNDSAGQTFWDLLYAAGADVVLNGHDHTYERFAPQDPTGAADPDRGIREFVVGTGGAGLYSFGSPEPNSEVRNNVAHGVLKLTLHPTSYDWEFIPIAGQAFTDSGRGACVSDPPPTSTPVPPTNTSVPPTATSTYTKTNTSVPPTNTPLPPTAMPTYTNTPLPPTDTPVPPTSTPVPPMATSTQTSTNTSVPPTQTPIPSTATAIPPTETPSNTPVPPSATPASPTATIVPPTATPTSEPEPEDINHDGKVNVLDVQLCVNVFLGVETDPVIVARSDVNGDGAVNVLDVQRIVNAFLMGPG